MERQYGQPIPVLAEISQRGRGKPCAVCGLAKRHVMNRIARDLGYDVLATGHNLDDEAAVLFGNTLRWSADFLRRQGPVLPETPGLARKVKPLCRFYEREMAAYALLRGIEYIYEECPFADGSTSIYYKDVLNRMENENPGTKLNFYLSFLESKEQGLFSPRDEAELAAGGLSVVRTANVRSWLVLILPDDRALLGRQLIERRGSRHRYLQRTVGLVWAPGWWEMEVCMDIISFAVYIAIKEIWRGRGRFFLLSLVIALITLLVLFIAALGEGLANANREYLSKVGAQLIVFREKSDYIIPSSRLDAVHIARHPACGWCHECWSDLHVRGRDCLD